VDRDGKSRLNAIFDFVPSTSKAVLKDQITERLTHLGMDARGMELFVHWLEGRGYPLTSYNGEWGIYMSSNSAVNGQIDVKVKLDSIRRQSSGTFFKRFHAQLQSGYFTGYQMLSGSNSSVGDFVLDGKADVQTKLQKRITNYKLKATWNDKIDPNNNYFGDIIFSTVIKTILDPHDYEAHISWDLQRTVELNLCTGIITNFTY
jgi:hypothetical protein